eukprot:scaffold14_cov380-Prasinococcus_capsulatus_cf.AAC.13
MCSHVIKRARIESPTGPTITPHTQGVLAKLKCAVKAWKRLELAQYRAVSVGARRDYGCLRVAGQGANLLGHSRSRPSYISGDRHTETMLNVAGNWGVKRLLQGRAGEEGLAAATAQLWR